MSQQQPYDGFGKDGAQFPSGLTEAELLAYLEGRLSPAETRRVEKLLSEEGMDSDAAEGLMDLPIAETQEMVQQLNLKMQRQLKKKRKRRPQRGDDKWAWIAILIVLILISVAYYLIHLMKAG